jgi:murein DD-endopeptidase MepM/ murein hydrolase activator NlpD
MDVIGLSGNTGRSTGAHLHFGLKGENGEWLDPSPYIPLLQRMNDPSLVHSLVHSHSFSAPKPLDWMDQQAHYAHGWMESFLRLFD